MVEKERLQKIQEELESKKVIAHKVYDLLKQERQSIADSKEILEIAMKYVTAAERKTPLC